MKFIEIAVIFCYSIAISMAALRFTNVKCTTFDAPFSTIERCDLKVLKRNVVAMNINVKLHQVPVHNVTVNFSILKKVSGYRPFLYNTTVDFCKFFRNRKRNPFLNIIYETLPKISNINHSCPYDHDVIVQDMVLEHKMFDKMPLPDGDYMFKVMVAAYNDWKAEVRMYFSISDM